MQRTTLLALLLTAGCHLVGGAGDYSIVDAGAGGHAGAGEGAAGVAEGGSGLAEGGSAGSEPVACVAPSDCPAGGGCWLPTCAKATCGLAPAPEGVSCSDDGGLVCDGDGACLACLEGPCDPYLCSADGRACLTSCSDSSECSAGYCDAGSCLSPQLAGSACDDAEQCEGGLCVDGVCCESACEGVCVSCAVPGSEGACVPVPAATDPAADCAPGLCDGSGACALGAHRWHATFGNGSEDVAVEDLAVDAMGSAVVIGRFKGSLDLGGDLLVGFGSTQSNFLAKYSAAGAHLWSRRFGGASADQFVDNVAIDAAGDVVVAGRFKGTVDFGGAPLTSQGGKYDIVVAKYDGQGNAQWRKRFGNGTQDQYAESLAIAPSGAILLAGGFRDPVDFGGGPLATGGGKYDAYVASFSAQGDHLWSLRMGNGTEDQLAQGVAAHPDGGAVVVGRFRDTVSFGGAPIASAGSKHDVFVARYGALGNHLWSQGHGNGVEDQRAAGVAVTTTGELVVVGSFRGAVDFGGGPLGGGSKDDIFVAGYDAAGAHSWSRRFGNGNDDQTGAGVAVDAHGQVVVTGRIRGGVDLGGGAIGSQGGKLDAFVAKYSAAGLHLWSRAYGNGLYDQLGNAVAVGPAGEIVAAGGFAGMVGFASMPTASTGAKLDGFVLALDP